MKKQGAISASERARALLRAHCIRPSIQMHEFAVRLPQLSDEDALVNPDTMVTTRKRQGSSESHGGLRSKGRLDVMPLPSAGVGVHSDPGWAFAKTIGT